MKVPDSKREDPPEDFFLSETGKQAYQTLVNADAFALGGVGISGRISDGEEALDVLLREKDSVKALQKIAGTVSSEGGLYALLGLRMLDRDRFAEAVKTYKKLPEPPEREGCTGETGKGLVTRRSGCKVWRQSRAEVTKQIVNGRFDG